MKFRTGGFFALDQSLDKLEISFRKKNNFFGVPIASDSFLYSFIAVYSRFYLLLAPDSIGYTLLYHSSWPFKLSRI